MNHNPSDVKNIIVERGCEWERPLQGMAQPLRFRINEFWNQPLVRRLDFKWVDSWPGESLELSTSAGPRVSWTSDSRSCS